MSAFFRHVALSEIAHKASEWWVLIVAVFIFYGMSALTSYYSFFGVHIGEYLSVADVIPLIFPTRTTLLVVPISILHVCVLYMIRLDSARGWLLFLALNLVCLGAVALLVNINLIYCSRFAWGLFLIHLFFPSFATLRSFRLTTVILVHMLLIWGFMMLYNYGRAQYAVDYSTKTIRFVYDSALHMQTSKDTAYIGQTISTLFLFDKPQQKTLIYDRSKISHLELLRGK